MKMIRYCYECGRVGPVGPTHINCCPDGIHAVEVPVQVAHQARAGFLASLAGQAAAPEGWRLAPETPTHAMFDAFYDAPVLDEGSESDWRKSYRAMLAAAPTPPGAAPARAPAAEPMTLEEIPDVELPGMWERADFIGGADDAASQPHGAAVARMLTEDEMWNCECATWEKSAAAIQREFCRINGIALRTATAPTTEGKN